MNFKFDERRTGSSSLSEPYRSEFEIDKSRIIHSEDFRRLQSKTQVLQTSEGDFHRNRLTHSIEVAQIGKGISRFIEYKYKEELSKYNITLDHDLIEAICLAHDIGHPPFGHGGEIALNYMMSEHGGFEGNGQTLRIISKLGKYSEEDGMNLTRRTCLGVLKYPCSFSELWNTDKKRKRVNNFVDLNQDEWMPPKCFFDEEQALIDWVLKVFTSNDRSTFRQFHHKSNENHLAKFKSFDCSIMDLADALSYSVHDFEDGLELGVFSDQLKYSLVEHLFNNEKFKFYLKKVKNYDEKTIANFKSLKEPKRFISVTIGFLIHNIEIEKNEMEFDCPYLQYGVKLNAEVNEILKQFTKLVWDNIILSPYNQEVVKKGQIVVCCLFDAFVNKQDLLPKSTKAKFESAENKYRIICDYISGMTDRYALKMYSKIEGDKITA